MCWQHPYHTNELNNALALINSMDRVAWPEEALDILFDCSENASGRLWHPAARRVECGRAR